MIQPDPTDDRDYYTGFGADSPLLAGSDSVRKALVMPDLLFVQYNCSRSEMSQSGNAGRLLLEALRRHPDPAATSGEIFGSVPQWAKEFSAVEAHERDHVRRLLSTSYGLLCHAFRAQKLVAARELVIEGARKQGGLKFPFDVMATTSEPGSSAHRARTAAQLQHALEDRLRIDVFRRADPFLAGWAAEGCEYVATDLPGDPAFSTLQTMDPGKGPTTGWLTSQHLLEMFGAFEEGNRLLGTGSRLEQVEERLSAADRRYSLPLLIWFTQFPSPPDRAGPVIRPPRPGEISLSFYRAFPLELFVAADLALWPPFSPEGLTSLNAELDWTDINPAYRFARILLAYKELGITPGEWPEEDLNVLIPDIQRRVCKRYGWPTPTDLATRWQDHLVSGSNTWFPDPALGGFRHTTALQLLALRRDRPGDVVVNNLDYQAAKVGRSAGWITLENSVLTPFVLAGEGDRQATELWFRLHALTPALLHTNWRRLLDLKQYSPETRRDCIEAFDIWGSAAADWPSDCFRREASAFLGLTPPG